MVSNTNHDLREGMTKKKNIFSVVDSFFSRLLYMIDTSFLYFLFFSHLFSLRFFSTRLPTTIGAIVF